MSRDLEGRARAFQRRGSRFVRGRARQDEVKTGSQRTSSWGARKFLRRGRGGAGGAFDVRKQHKERGATAAPGRKRGKISEGVPGGVRLRSRGGGHIKTDLFGVKYCPPLVVHSGAAPPARRPGALSRPRRTTRGSRQRATRAAPGTRRGTAKKQRQPGPGPDARQGAARDQATARQQARRPATQPTRRAQQARGSGAATAHDGTGDAAERHDTGERQQARPRTHEPQRAKATARKTRRNPTKPRRARQTAGRPAAGHRKDAPDGEAERRRQTRAPAGAARGGEPRSRTSAARGPTERRGGEPRSRTRSDGESGGRAPRPKRVPGPAALVGQGEGRILRSPAAGNHY